MKVRKSKISELIALNLKFVPHGLVHYDNSYASWAVIQGITDSARTVDDNVQGCKAVQDGVPSK